MYPYYAGLEGHGLGGLKLKTQQNTHAATLIGILFPLSPENGVVHMYGE